MRWELFGKKSHMLPKVTQLSHPTTAGKHVGWVHQQERHKDMTYGQLHICLEFRGGCKGIFPTSFKLPFMGPLVFFFVLSPSLHLLHSPRFPAISHYTLSLKTVPFQISIFLLWASKPHLLWIFRVSEQWLGTSKLTNFSLAPSEDKWCTIMLDDLLLTKIKIRRIKGNEMNREPILSPKVYGPGYFICTLKENYKGEDSF